MFWGATQIIDYGPAVGIRPRVAFELAGGGLLPLSYSGTPLISIHGAAGDEDVGVLVEFQFVTGLQSEVLADAQRDCDLTLTGNGRCHAIESKILK